MQDRLQEKWISTFERVFALCAVAPGDTAAILSETLSRPVLVELAELALHRLGARPFHVVLPSPAQRAPVPVRSTGASDAIQGLEPAVTALEGSALVVDCTVEGILHAPELGRILKAGARVLTVSNEHPDALERLVPDPEETPRIKEGVRCLRAASRMVVRSAAGTDLDIDLRDTPAAGVWGYCEKPGQIAHWPGGLVLCFPKAGTVRGRLVLDAGDVNLTFKRYVETPFSLTVEDDHIVSIEGRGLDAELFRQYIAAWGDREAYAVSHVGWGMNPAARWEAMTMYDRDDFNGTELRAFAGNFLYSTGANEAAKRYTLGHFDIPVRNCTILLDGEAVVEDGRVVPSRGQGPGRG